MVAERHHHSKPSVLSCPFCRRGSSTDLRFCLASFKKRHSLGAVHVLRAPESKVLAHSVAAVHRIFRGIGCLLFYLPGTRTTSIRCSPGSPNPDRKNIAVFAVLCQPHLADRSLNSLDIMSL
jgi:hypothetical protein